VLLSDAVPWMAIITSVVVVPIFVFLGSIYAYRFYLYWMKNREIIQKNIQIDDTDPNRGDDGSIISGSIYPRTVEGVPKKAIDIVYNRAESQESRATLLTDPKRNASGSSDTTSGCESARSSEIGAADFEYDDEQNAAAAAAGEESYNINHLPPIQMTNKVTPYIDSAANGYVVAHRPPNQQVVSNPSYSDVASWPENGQHKPPLGYSRLSAVEPIAHSAAAAAAAAGAAGWPHQPAVAANGASRGTAVLNGGGYVTLAEAQRRSPPISQGYISLAQANKMNAVAPPTAAAADQRLQNVDETAAAAYSKVGIGAPATDISTPPPAYQGNIQHQMLSKPRMSDSSLFPRPQTLNSLLLNTSTSAPPRPSTCSVPLSALTTAPTPPSKGYVQMSEVMSNGSSSNSVNPLPPQESVLMSPKGLKVESRSPYSKVDTILLLNSKSTMV
jgi:hypothetical protein